MFNIPDNPYAHHPERYKYVRDRLVMGIGSAITSSVSIYYIYKLPPLDVAREWLQFSTLASGITTLMPVVAELQERYRRYGDGGNGGCGWFPPEFPDLSPKGGSGVPIPVQTPVSV